MATFDMKSLVLVTDGLTGSAVLFGAQGGQSASSPDPIDIDAIAAYILNATNQGTTKAGLRLNNLTTTQRDALASPVRGQAIYNTSTDVPNYYNGSAWTTFGTSVSPANPSASLGLSAVNGSAATFMRSDAAPALSQAIIPTWTGPHTFNAAIVGVSVALSSFFSIGTIPAGINNFQMMVTGVLRQAVFDRATTSDYAEFAFTTGGAATRDWTLGTRAGDSNFYIFRSNTGVAWKVDTSNNLLAGTDNSWDIGAAGATRPANIYAGTLVRTPALRIDAAPSAVGTGTKTISNAADSSTNFGHYFSINLNGTTYFIPCSATAPT